MLLSEYIITPDVFDFRSYINDNNFDNSEPYRTHLYLLNSTILGNSLIRDFNGGKWKETVKNINPMSPDINKKILESLTTKNLLIEDTFFNEISNTDIKIYKKWFNLAILSHRNRNVLNNIIISKVLQEEFKRASDDDKKK